MHFLSIFNHELHSLRLHALADCFNPTPLQSLRRMRSLREKRHIKAETERNNSTIDVSQTIVMPLMGQMHFSWPGTRASFAGVMIAVWVFKFFAGSRNIQFFMMIVYAAQRSIIQEAFERNFCNVPEYFNRERKTLFRCCQNFRE